MLKVLVTGANGQLGRCLEKHSGEYPRLQLDLRDKATLDITSKARIHAALREGVFDYCINAAAYTAVEAAERHPEQARAVNATAVKHLAGACSENGVCLVHISTDYVFDGLRIPRQTPPTPSTRTDGLNGKGKNTSRR